MNIPQIGDKVVYHPRPSDRVRKPDNFGGLVSHMAHVAHVHPDGTYNLCAIDSGGVPYPAASVPGAPVIFVPKGGKHPEYGGWFEWYADDAAHATNPDPFIKG